MFNLADVFTETFVYRLRTAGLVPGGQAGGGEFVLQTFGAEKITNRIWPSKIILLESDDMKGLGGEYVSASFQGSNYKTEEGEFSFSGQAQLPPDFIDESEIPGA